MIRPQWVWELDDAEGTVLEDPVSPVFGNQFDAEQWLGEHWRDLLSRGVATVTLFEGTTKVYGPMGLAPADGS